MGGSAAWIVGTLQRQACRDARGLGCRRCGTSRPLTSPWPPGPVLLYRSAQRALRWYPWPGPFSIAQHIRHRVPASLWSSVDQPPAAATWGEKDCSDGSAPGVTQQHRLASRAARPSSDGTPRRALLPQVCSGHLPAVNSRSCPGIALQSPSPSSIPEDAGPCPGM